jgi:hypothetical protein
LYVYPKNTGQRGAVGGLHHEGFYRPGTIRIAAVDAALALARAAAVGAAVHPVKFAPGLVEPEAVGGAQAGVKILDRTERVGPSNFARRMRKESFSHQFSEGVPAVRVAKLKSAANTWLVSLRRIETGEGRGDDRKSSKFLKKRLVVYYLVNNV